MSLLQNIKKFLPFRSYLDFYYKKIDYYLFNKTALRPHEIKDFEFWNYLGKILLSVKPNAILELGSGKSSLVFADYASKKNVKFESIEQNYFYVRKIRKALRYSFLSSQSIKYVPLVNGWYDVSKIPNIKYDFIFVDGPTTGILKRSSRVAVNAVNFLKKYIDNCKIIIFDDSQRDSEINLINQLNIDTSKFEFIEINCYRSYPNTRMRIYYKISYSNFIKKDANIVV